MFATEKQRFFHIGDSYSGNDNNMLFWFPDSSHIDI